MADQQGITKTMAFLLAEVGKGQNWVAYDGWDVPDDATSLTCFMTDQEADKFCMEMNYRFDQEEGNFIDCNYRFRPIVNLLAILNPSVGNNQVSLSKEDIESLFAKDNLTLHWFDSMVDVTAQLNTGGIAKVVFNREIIPLNEMSSFHIVLHAHEYHSTIYEIGHKRKVLKSYNEYPEALEKFLANALPVPTPSGRLHCDHILVGQFKDQILELDYEGHPAANCGMAIATARYNNKNELEVQMSMDPSKALVNQQKLFVRIHRVTTNIEFLDGNLNPVVLGQTMISASTDNLHIYNSAEILVGITNNILPATGQMKARHVELMLPQISVGDAKTSNMISRLFNDRRNARESNVRRNRGFSKGP